MKIVLIGATGFIGQRLFTFLDLEEYELTVVTRDTDAAQSKLGEHAEFCQWDGVSSTALDEIIRDSYAIINLAGEGIAALPWTTGRKEKLMNSRVDTTRAVVEAINRAESKPEVLIQASAIGYYGSDFKNTFDESSPAGQNFLASIAKNWEAATEDLDPSVRLAIIRTGIVIGPNDGALESMAKPFKMKLGGHLGSGKQWFSWIHLDDEVMAIRFLLENKNSSGIYNLTAPEPVRMKTFAKELGRVLKRMSWIHIPTFIIRLTMGQMGKEMLLSSQKVTPKRLLEEGFYFQFSDLRIALTSIYNA